MLCMLTKCCILEHTSVTGSILFMGTNSMKVKIHIGLLKVLSKKHIILVVHNANFRTYANYIIWLPAYRLDCCLKFT